MKFKPVLEAYPPYLKLLALLILVFVCMLFTSILAWVAGTAIFGREVMQHISDAGRYTDPDVIRALKFFQLLSQAGVFLLPVVLFSVLASGKPTAYLRLHTKSSVIVFLFSGIAIIAALPLINWLAEINSHMHLPAALEGAESWMKRSEAEAGALTGAFLQSATMPGFLFNILMMAIIPAIGEELLFRGLIMRLFREWFRDIHLAIFVSAFIFSAIHMQFYGFFPRLMMGVMFGYLFYWSGSIWIPIIVHFINNAIIVTFGFASARGLTALNPDTVGSTDNVFILLACGLILAFALLVVFRNRKKDQPDVTDDRIN